jgi:methylated-DNA-[protein]-cysteine S-methyltransferase
MTVPAALDRRFRDEAAAHGLLDVAYELADSPVGPLLIAATEAGVCRVAFDPDPEQEAELLARSFGVRVLRAPKPVEAARRQLDEYFAQRRRDFDLEFDLRATPSFQQRVLHELARVPYGEVATYGGLAARIGKPRAARAVGGALNRNPVPIILPCHRVVGASGSLVGYGGGLDRKRALLDLEGADMERRT